jgi:hypothetical protein
MMRDDGQRGMAKLIGARLKSWYFFSFTQENDEFKESTDRRQHIKCVPVAQNMPYCIEKVPSNVAVLELQSRGNNRGNPFELLTLSEHML